MGLVSKKIIIFIGGLPGWYLNLKMVVHRGASWDSSPDTSHRSTLQTINTSHRSSLQTITQNSLLSSTESDASRSRCKRISSDDQSLLFQSVSNN